MYMQLLSEEFILDLLKMSKLVLQHFVAEQSEGELCVIRGHDFCPSSRVNKGPKVQETYFF